MKYDSNYSILYDIAEKLGIENISDECTYSRVYDIYAEETDNPDSPDSFDSIYGLAYEIYKAEGGSSDDKFNSIFSICYAIYALLGGEETKDSFDSTYSILLAILDVIQDTGIYVFYKTLNNEPIVNTFTQTAVKTGTKNGMFYLKFNELTTIPESAFQGEANLTEIILPNTLTSIGKQAFNTTRLSSVIIPDSVKTIGFGAFASSILINNVIIGSGVESIGDNGFLGDINSTDYVRFKCSTPPIGSGGDDDWKQDFMYQNVVMYVPQGSVTAYENAFLNLSPSALDYLEIRAYTGE